jgi:hypothetical protein
MNKVMDAIQKPEDGSPKPESPKELKLELLLRGGHVRSFLLFESEPSWDEKLLRWCKDSVFFRIGIGAVEHTFRWADIVGWSVGPREAFKNPDPTHGVTRKVTVSGVALGEVPDEIKAELESALKAVELKHNAGGGGDLRADMDAAIQAVIAKHNLQPAAN